MGVKGFGTKNAVETCDPQAPLFVGRVGLPGLDDLVDQLRDAQHIRIRLRREAQHEVELDIVPAAGKGGGAGREDLLFGDVFIDDVPQALRPGFRGEGQAALADLLQLLHQRIRRSCPLAGRARRY